MLALDPELAGAVQRAYEIGRAGSPPRVVYDQLGAGLFQTIGNRDQIWGAYERGYVAFVNVAYPQNKGDGQLSLAEAHTLASERETLRAAKDWAQADAIRVQLMQTGWIIQDRADGYALRRDR